MTIERGLSANTVAAYGRDLRRYLNWCQGKGLSSVSRIEANDVADFSISLRSDGPSGAALSASSAGRAVISVRGFHRFALLEQWTIDDPSADVQPVRAADRLPHALDYSEVEQLIASAGDHDTPLGLRDVALLEFLYGTGARITEAVSVDVDDVDLANRVVTVLGKGRKQRRIPLGDYAASAVDAYLLRGRPALTPVERH